MVGTKGRSNQNLINTNKQHKKTKTKKEKKREKKGRRAGYYHIVVHVTNSQTIYSKLS